jgi:hypothetical protein
MGLAINITHFCVQSSLDGMHRPGPIAPRVISEHFEIARTKPWRAAPESRERSQSRLPYGLGIARTKPRLPN